MRRTNENGVGKKVKQTLSNLHTTIHYLATVNRGVILAYFNRKPITANARHVRVHIITIEPFGNRYQAVAAEMSVIFPSK